MTFSGGVALRGTTVQDKTDSPITVDRVDGVFSISFDLGDDKWRIEYSKLDAKFLINDETHEKVFATPIEKVKEMLWKEWG